MGDRTRTLNDEREANQPFPAAFLFLALEAHRPAEPSARFSLFETDLVVLGRGDRRTVERGHANGKRTLTIRVPDPWMSTVHARLVREEGGWTLEDAGSKNGTVLEGSAVKRASITDGDMFETGRTFLLFRLAVPTRPADVVDADAARLAVPAGGLETLLPPLAERFAKLTQVAASGVSVVLGGESGTGKEVIARAIHAMSGRRGAFVAVNCGAIPEALVESELFGHRAGAFSGAVEDRAGLIRSADGGTLFLDEIGDLPAASQAAFLRVLQEREVLPVGGVRPVRVDLRLVAATHRDLGRLVDEGGFRADLYARITGFQLDLPPLRDRREDLGLLVASILRRHAPERFARLALDARAARAVFRHDWPLNIRELDKALSAALVLAGDRPISLEDLPAPVQLSLQRAPRRRGGPDATQSLPPSLSAEDDALRARLVSLLREHHGTVSAVARTLGKDRKQIQRWLKRFALDPEQFRGNRGQDHPRKQK